VPTKEPFNVSMDNSALAQGISMEHYDGPLLKTAEAVQNATGSQPKTSPPQQLAQHSTVPLPSLLLSV
jgi:hypothetical protein